MELAKKEMKLEIEVYDCLCELSKFIINWIDADYDDFWDKYDRHTEEAEEYWCWYMQFEWCTYTQDILDKYNISIEDYNKIVTILEDKLSFWCCWRCV